MKRPAKARKRELEVVQSSEFEVQGSDLTQNSELETRNYLWHIACSVITAIAAFLRFWQLELKPLHHDEGVNGYFLTTLFREGIYKYDPTNYHGPTLYYVSLAFTKIFGLETFSIRASVAVFGVLIVILTFFLRRYIGAAGSLFAALLLALAPGMVFTSRYFIHEILFVFLSLAMAVSILFFIENRKPGIFAIGWTALLLLICFAPPALNLASFINQQNTDLVWIWQIAFVIAETVLVFFAMRILLDWNEGKPVYLLLASACAALTFATKETAFITIGTMLIACVCVWLWRKIYRRVFSEIKQTWLESVELKWSVFRERLGSNSLLLSGAAAIIFVYVGVLFFSSFFTYTEGVSKAFEAYAFWTKTGTDDHTQNGAWGYAKWLWKLESPIFMLSALGTLIAFAKARHRFATFAGLWAFGLFAAYSIIPYKTPWLMLSFVLPMCIIAGYGINELFISRYVLLKIAAGVLAFVSIGILGYQTYELNFVRYDDDKMPYVYAHTRRGFLDLIEKIEYYAKKSGAGKDAGVEIISPDYWSMPWYLRDYQRANFHEKFVPANEAEMIVAKKGEQDDTVKLEYAADYKYAGTYPLRPGVELMLLVRRDLADSGTKDLYNSEMNEVPIIEVTPEPSPTKSEKFKTPNEKHVSDTKEK